ILHSSRPIYRVGGTRGPAHPLRRSSSACQRGRVKILRPTDPAMTVVVRAPRPSPLPMGMMPRGLSRVQAAFYVGVSTTLFEKLVIEGTMPKPVRLRGRVL